jgi:hypothetical protein
MKTNEICNPKIPKYSCESCDYNTSNKTNYEKHLQTEKHFEKINCNIATSSCKKLQLYLCENCDYTTSHKSHYDKHCETLKCKSVTKCRKVPKSAEKCRKNDEIICDDNASAIELYVRSPETPNTLSVTKKSLSKKDKQKNAEFQCENCDYVTSVKANYERHCQTLKCRSVTKDKKDKKISELASKEEFSPSFECECGKTFKDRTGLWRHNKICNNRESVNKLMDMVMELAKNQAAITNIDNRHTNCHNKQFNLNFFLNETCKDAYNISEFVEQLDVSMEDMLNTSRVGYTNGISEIIVNGLKALDETKRPIHCTDVKRETLYIKDNNEWIKEADDRPILLGAVKKIAGKNIKQISEWCKQHPNYRDSTSRDNDIHLKILCNVMQGGTDAEIHHSFCTVFRNIATGTRIRKH